MPPFYRDPALLLLVATAAATAFFTVLVSMRVERSAEKKLRAHSHADEAGDDAVVDLAHGLDDRNA
jgi:hypothetical protein